MIKARAKSVLPWMTFPAIPDQSAAMAMAMQFQLEQSQWLTPSEILAHQLQQLRPLLAHARKTSPYYREKIPASLAEHHFSLEEFRSLPLLERETVREHGELLHSQQLPQAHASFRITETSGSTGTPVKIRLSEINNLLWHAFALREHHWHSRDLSGVLCSIRWRDRSVACYPEGIEAPDWGSITSTCFTTGKSYLLNISSSVDEQLEWLLRKKPDYLLSFPSNLAALAEASINRNIRIPGLRQVRTIAETLSPQTRQLIEEAWGVKTADIYSCEEAGYLAIQCPLHDHYHIQSENILLEILDDNNQPCQPGEEGRVFITALHNYCTPLIRYELGDRAIAGDSCSCGRGLPVLQRVLGRQRNRLLMPDGSRQFPYHGNHGDIVALTGVNPRQRQYIQKTADCIEVIFALDEPLSKENEAKLDRMNSTNFGKHFHFTYRYVKHIPKGPSGKFEEFVCLC